MGNPVLEAIEIFDANVNDVRQLMNFDRDVLDLAINQIRDLKEKLRQLNKIDNPQLSAERVLKGLEHIRGNDSLRSRYETIFNQALVLLVSYFASAVAELFKLALMKSLEGDATPALLQEDLRLSLRELRETDYDLNEGLADIFVEKHDISFQDMQSISRSFKKYLEIDVPPKDREVNNIIMGQAARHVIVHAGGMINERLVRQVSNSKPRDLKLELPLDTKIQFSPDEVDKIAASMRKYIDTLGKSIATKLPFNDTENG